MHEQCPRSNQALKVSPQSHPTLCDIRRKSGVSIAIWPEGTKANDPELEDMHKHVNRVLLLPGFGQAHKGDQQNVMVSGCEVLDATISM